MKTTLLLIAVLFLVFITTPLKADTKFSKAAIWADSVIIHMTLEEKIGQLFMIAAYSNQNENYENELEKQIRKYQVGGVIFFQGDPVRQVKMTNRLQKASKYPLMIGMDAEHGVGWRLKTAMEFPKMLIDGAIRNDSLIFALGATIARHCHELGVHVNFAPVVDINSNPRNPIIGMRSFGEQPERVTQRAILYAQGSLSGQVLPVLKHFPGHGDTDSDSHYTLPLIRHSRPRLDSIELYPYRTMIRAGIPAIMISHLNVKALDTTGTPSSLSPQVINQVLREELGFQGLCFTDAMNMKGVTQNTATGEAEVKALIAGNDILLFPANLPKAIEAIRQAIADSLLSEKLITEKCRKVLIAKYQYVLPNIHPSEATGLWSRINTPADLALRQELYKNAITLIKNKHSLLPLKRLDTLQIASLNFGGTAVNNFQTTLSRYTDIRNFNTGKQLSEEEIREWKQKLKNYNCIIIYNSLSNNSASKNFGYSASLSKLIQNLQGKYIILCHPGIPYGLGPYTKLPIDAFLLCYEDHPYARQFAAQAIFGGIAVTGMLPVSINASYPSGTGICTPQTRLGYLSPEMCGIDSGALSPIDSLCELAIRLKATPGCQVLVAKNGNIIYNKAFGFHTYKKKIANQTDDIYDIASVTKITSTLPAIMKLYEEKQIGLDSVLSLYYPPLLTTDKKNITIREVLCHNAGLKASLPLFCNAIDSKSIPGPLFTTRATATNTTKLKDRLYVNLNYRFRDSTLSNTPKPGYKFIAPGLYMYPSYQDTILNSILNSPLNVQKNYLYSDLGFVLLKFTVETLTGKSISRYCKETFYQQLGMNNTDYKAAERLSKKRIIPSCEDRLYRKAATDGYVHDPTAALLGGIAGHAGLFSTAEDLAKMLQMYLNQGNYGGEAYFLPQTLSIFTGKNNEYRQNRRGLGFDKPEADSTKISPTCRCAPLSSYGHTGFTGIMAWCDPENNLLYLFLSNRTYPDEFNSKLSDENIRTKIQEVIYNAIK